ncbi:MAG: Ku protein [Methanomicrobiales archaeon]|nr:Ku protein [Methanomicrobiales archaeon]
MNGTPAKKKPATRQKKNTPKKSPAEQEKAPGKLTTVAKDKVPKPAEKPLQEEKAAVSTSGKEPDKPAAGGNVPRGEKVTVPRAAGEIKKPVRPEVPVKEPAAGKPAALPRRPIWRGTISIGLVNVPVRLHSMIKERGWSFRLLHRDDGQPLRYDRVCTKDDKVIPWEDTVRGYEVRKGEYVVFEKEELEAILPESDKRIRIDKFVYYLSLDPVYFDRPYVLSPDGNSDPYVLLHEALLKQEKAGVGRLTLRTKEYPVLIRPYHGALVLTTLRYAQEVSDPGKFVELEELSSAKPREVEVAEKIVSELSGDFDVNEYHDRVREQIELLVKKKLAGEKIVREAPRHEEAKELMAALQETLQQLKTT